MDSKTLIGYRECNSKTVQEEYHRISCKSYHFDEAHSLWKHQIKNIRKFKYYMKSIKQKGF